jgi:hypothetical protein
VIVRDSKRSDCIRTPVLVDRGKCRRVRHAVFGRFRRNGSNTREQERSSIVTGQTQVAVRLDSPTATFRGRFTRVNRFTDIEIGRDKQEPVLRNMNAVRLGTLHQEVAQ